MDLHIPDSAETLAAVLREDWPRLSGRVRYLAQSIEDIDLTAADLVVSAHACGHLTDLVLDRAMAVGARVAVLPCCHDLKHADTGGLEGWLEGPLAVDAVRAARLRAADYRVVTQTIPGDITPKNRLLLGEPE